MYSPLQHHGILQIAWIFLQLPKLDINWIRTKRDFEKKRKRKKNQPSGFPIYLLMFLHTHIKCGLLLDKKNWKTILTILLAGFCGPQCGLWFECFQAAQSKMLAFLLSCLPLLHFLPPALALPDLYLRISGTIECSG